MRRATEAGVQAAVLPFISIHALHEESDSATPEYVHAHDISIHALHEESDPSVLAVEASVLAISIHALHEESDPSVLAVEASVLAISIHALHEESDTKNATYAHMGVHFNPRSP